MPGRKVASSVFIIIFFVASGCITVKQDAIKLPYQKALEGYYAALDNLERDPQALAGALAKVNEHLAKTPADLEARILRANISLQLVRKMPDDATSTRSLIQDLQRVSLSVGTGTAEDWVQPRAYITMGDYFLIQGRHWQAKVLPQNQGNLFHPILARALYAAAKNYYLQASGFTNSTGTVGLKRELLNAQNGYVNALQGMVAAIDVMNPAQFDVALQARTQDLEALRKYYEEAKLAVIGGNQVGFDPAAHTVAKTTYNLLRGDTTKSIDEWCGDSAKKALLTKPALTNDEKKLVDEFNALLEKRRLYSEYAATQAVIEQVLSLQPLTPDRVELQTANTIFRRSLKTPCSP